MTEAQGLRIHAAIAFLNKDRDVRALVTEDNLVAHGWISSRMELDPDQLHGPKSGPKKPKTAAGPSTQAIQLKKASTSQPPSVASSLKKPICSKSAAPLPLTVESGDEDEEPLVRSKRSRTEVKVTPEVVSSHLSSPRGEDVLTSQTEAVPSVKDS